MKVKYLVTGGAGFIGSHIVEYLVREGHEVVIIDDLSTGSIHNLNTVRDAVTFHQGSLLDVEILKKAMTGAQCVFHLAAFPSVPKSITHPIATHEVNVTGTLSVLDMARQLGVQRVVYASSSAVYGDSAVLPKVETMEYNPVSPYAAHKMMCEYYAKLYHTIFGLETVGLRYFNVFGPRQDPESEYAAVVPKFIKQIMKQSPVTIYGDGETTRDFTYVDNVVHASIQAVTADVAGEVFNIALGVQVSLNELVQKICALYGVDIKPVYEDFRDGDIKHSFADIHKAERLLQFIPPVSFEDGLKRTIDAMRLKGNV